jgi:hypothetical protein
MTPRAIGAAPNTWHRRPPTGCNWKRSVASNRAAYASALFAVICSRVCVRSAPQTLHLGGDQRLALDRFRGRSAELLSEPDEKAFGPADVAEPIRVLVLDHFAADELRAVLTESGKRLVDVVDGEHDA